MIKRSTVAVLGGPVVFVKRAKVLFYGALAALAVGLLSIPVVPWLLTLLMILASPALLVAAWITPTFAARWIEPAALVPGMLLIASDAGAAVRQLSENDRQAKAIVAIFEHHGREKPVWVALGGGPASMLARSDRVFVAEKDDWFDSWRPGTPGKFEAYVDPSSTLPLLSHLWNLNAAGEPEAAMESIAAETQQSEINMAEALGLIAVKRPQRRTKTVLLTNVGRIVVASEMRKNGQEPYANSGEKRMTYFHNEGIYIDRSPGAAAVQGGGEATGGDVSGIDPAVLQQLRELLKLAPDLSTRLDADEQYLVEVSTDVIEQQLASGSPDVSKLKAATRAVLGAGKAVILGAGGSGLWAALALWSGL